MPTLTSEYGRGMSFGLGRAGRIFAMVEPLAWSLYAPTWDRTSADPSRAQTIEYILDEVFTGHARSGQSVLDLGCGTGGNALALYRQGFAVIGVDASRAMLRRARRHARQHAGSVLRFQYANFNRPLPLASASIDHAVCVSALQCAIDPTRVVREIMRVVRPAGVICLVTSAGHSRRPTGPLPAHHRLLRTLKTRVEHRMLVRQFAPGDLVAILDAAGARDAKVDTVQGFLVATARAAPLPG